jgi:molecular chaperone HscB
MNDDQADDPFALLDLPRSYDIDPRALRRALLERTSALHPDRPGAPEDAAERLSAVNDAARRLADPEQRAIALLRLSGAEQGPASRDLPEGFLTEMLEIREEMEHAASAGDRQTLTRLEGWAAERRAAHTARIAALFRACADRPDPAQARAIRLELNAWRYIERMIEQM